MLTADRLDTGANWRVLVLPPAHKRILDIPKEEIARPMPRMAADPVAAALRRTDRRRPPSGTACARHRAPPRYTKSACGPTLTDRRSRVRPDPDVVERTPSRRISFARKDFTVGACARRSAPHSLSVIGAGLHMFCSLARKTPALPFLCVLPVS